MRNMCNRGCCKRFWWLKIFKLLRRKLGINHGVFNVGVAEISLNGASVFYTQGDAVMSQMVIKYDQAMNQMV